MIEQRTLARLFFEGLIEEAWSRQNWPLVEIEQVQIKAYLLNLLESFMQKDASSILEKPLLEELAQKMDVTMIREIADTMLFMTGVFGLRLVHSFMGIRYYIQVGELAYASLYTRTKDTDVAKIVFKHFALDIRPYINVLIEISGEHLVQFGYQHVLLVYERYRATKSEYDRQWLVRHQLLLPSSTFRH